ncbi:hypothetical protein EJB05_13583, partial [Eragrostis curvula]
MASEADADGDEDVLVHQLPLDMDGGHVRRIAHILPPLHAGDSPPPPGPFRPPPPLQAAASAEPRLSFRGWLGAPRHWDLWVAKLRPIHAALWRRLGIHDAVLASTFRFRRDASALLHLASFWCPHTNTFAFPWGEATVTLHDVAVLAGLPAAGAPLPAPLAPDWRPDEAALNGVRLGFNRSACKKAHHSAWIKYFLTDHVSDVPLEHEHAAFLALWLTRFVLPGHPESTMRQSLFPIAVRLARGERLALGPAVLASLYRDLRDIKAFLVATAGAATNGNADMLSSLSLYAPLYVLQLWMWEHFPALRPGRDKPLMDGQPMAARWHDLSRKINPTLIREALSSPDNFLWQPYPYSMHTTGWVRGSNLAENDDLRSLVHCLRPCELVGMDCIEQYLPHRVARQFGLDQDVPGDVPRANQNWAVAWQTYELEGKNVAFFIPQTKPGVTARYARWWRKQLPHSDLHAGPSSVPMERKTSKRKVKKTLVAMEAEADKEHRLKKARVSPAPSDKKRKLEELYDSNLSDWLTTARNGISDAAGGSYQRGASLPKYDTASDEALLPNVGPTNDDVVLLAPRKQTTSPVVMLMTDSSINATIRDGGTFIDDIPCEPEGVTTATLQEEKLMISADAFSLFVTDSPGGTVAMESGKEASGASDTPEEVTAPITEKKEEKFDTGETNCVSGMNPLEKNIAVVMKANEGNAVYEEVGRSAKEAVEVALQSQQEVDAGAMNYLHVAVVLPEEELPIHHTSNSGGCSKVSCTMEDSNVSGGLSTNGGETTCYGFVVEEQRDVRSVEVIGGGVDHQIALEKEFDMDLVDDSKTSTDGERPCGPTIVQLKGDQMGVSHEDRMQEQHVQNVELIDQTEPSSDAASMKEATLKQEQDHKTSCNNRETTVLEGSHMMDRGVKSDLVALDVDATLAAGEIQNQKIFDADKQLAVEERQDLGITVENNEMDLSKGADNMVCDEHQINPTTIEVNEVESPMGIQNQECIDNEEQLAMEGRQDIGTTIEKNKMHALDIACSDILVCGEHEIDLTGTEVNEIESTRGMQNQEPSNDKETRADKQQHGVENVNKKRISQDTSVTGSDELNSEATILDVNMAGSRKETPNQCALVTEKEAVVPEEYKGTADQNTEGDLANIDTLECGVKLDEAVNIAHETLLTAQDIVIEGFVISSENKQMEAPLGRQNITEAQGYESNNTVVKEPETALPPKPENPVEVEQENVENETEMSICRDNDEESEKYHTSAEVTITPNDNGLAEDLISNPKNTTCHYPLKCGKSSIEEVKRTYDTRLMYLKDIEESLGRIRAEPISRVKPTSNGNYSRHADQEPISVCKDIKVPLRGSARDFGRDRAPELVLTSPPEETS